MTAPVFDDVLASAVLQWHAVTAVEPVFGAGTALTAVIAIVVAIGIAPALVAIILGRTCIVSAAIPFVVALTLVVAPAVAFTLGESKLSGKHGCGQ